MFVSNLKLNNMENISFKKEQFDAMARVLKADLIEKCIKNISENNSVKIDSKAYRDSRIDILVN